jgi:hypothetical protein
MRIVFGQIVALTGTLLSGISMAQPLPNTPELFVRRSYVCSHQRSTEYRRLAACDSLKRDKADLLRRYRDQPKILAMINHPERVRSVGYVGTTPGP